MNRIEALESNKFRFSSSSEIALLSLKEEDANQLVMRLDRAANDLLTSNKSISHKGLEIHYKHLRLFFKAEKTHLNIIHLVHINAFPLNGNLVYEAV